VCDFFALRRPKESLSSPRKATDPESRALFSAEVMFGCGQIKMILATPLQLMGPRMV
jgi:hypothetical protein